MIGTLVRMGLMFALMSYLTGSGKKGESPTAGGSAGRLGCFFGKGDLVDVDVYVSTARGIIGRQIWHEPAFRLADSDSRSKSISLTEDDLAPVIQHNETLYMITRFSRTGFAVNESTTAPFKSVPGATFYKVTALVDHRPPPKRKTGKSLLGGDGDDETAAAAGGPAAVPADAQPTSAGLEDEEECDAEDTLDTRPWVSFFKPNLTINIVDDFKTYSPKAMPPYWQDHMDVSISHQMYNPVVHVSEFWLLQDYLIPLNATVRAVDLHLELGSISQWWFQMQIAIDQSLEMQKSGGMMGENEVDEMKRVFLEGNPYLLALTFAVSLLHSVFDMLAFKNDIGFWKNNKSMEGLSARTILINAGCQLVIFLYLLDNETSMVVLFSAGVGTAIEFWKVTKAMNITVERGANGLPRLTFADRGSYVQTKTKQYDAEAMKYLSWAIFPLIVCYCGYSLKYQQHKSWYSWILSSMVGCVYAFGFILMCPQLYLNYKLKSVAHLPWRQMTYKFLNTIIDDLFAFVIKMPLLHRLSVFRDDVVFLVYMYQRWIYRVDRKRVNEFGFSDEAPDEDGEAAAGAAAGAAVAAITGAQAGDAAESAALGGGKRKQAVRGQVAEADNSTAAEGTKTKDK